jgi:hypothetical protein
MAYINFKGSLFFIERALFCYINFSRIIFFSGLLSIVRLLKHNDICYILRDVSLVLYIGIISNIIPNSFIYEILYFGISIIGLILLPFLVSYLSKLLVLYIFIYNIRLMVDNFIRDEYCIGLTGL